MEQTVQKAMNLLEALVRSGQPRRLTELSRELGLTKPNVYRLLSTLSVLGYVKKDPLNSLYSPTLKLWEMGSMLVRDVDLVSVAGPRLRKLSSDCHESVQLAVFDGGFVVYVDKVDSAQPLKAITSIGSRVPASVTSTGKAMLAWLGDEALDQAAEHVKRYTPLTLCGARTSSTTSRKRARAAIRSIAANSARACAASPCRSAIAPEASSPPLASGAPRRTSSARGATSSHTSRWRPHVTSRSNWATSKAARGLTAARGGTRRAPALARPSPTRYWRIRARGSASISPGAR
jgi:DNA-binding IclR family transcriptional regulator